MKRYLLFMGDQYYPSGGWKDLFSSFESVESALLKVCEKGPDWFEVVDSVTGQVVIDNN